ncbi:AraC family transcriptional regulator [Thauera sinica]|uniref:AraC family transcriptional regulator n=1 Tax=Thauera sinica TaxID=2665146 RepID=A0ABW1ATW6_9RHOO|nr:AraC family transcriptional regulator [Thauera sp. K11]ATE62051.1 AraC family transcriptional regulator [Thauera sp. K11]
MAEARPESFELLRSTDLDETRQLVAGKFCEHRLALARADSVLDYAHRHTRVGQLSFGLMRYGAEVRIEPREPESFYLVQLTLAGADRMEVDARALDCTAALASVVGPDQSFRMNWSADCSKLAVRIEREALERHARSLLGDMRCPPLRFRPDMDVRRGGASVWMRTVQQLLAELGGAAGLLDSPLLQVQFEQLVMSGLLVWQPNSLSDLLGRPAPEPLPRHVRLAEEYMHANPGAPITVEELAGLTGVSVRTLYNGFRRHRGMTPMRYLKDLRMERVRQDLLDPGQPRSVTALAIRWGFLELGRFSADYRERYGELPSATLQRASPARLRPGA